MFSVNIFIISGFLYAISGLVSKIEVNILVNVFLSYILAAKRMFLRNSCSTVIHRVRYQWFNWINLQASCPLANKTAEIVSSCPQTDEEWEKAAKRKNCENITHLCQSYIYHCVINAWMNATIEVCAPSRFIIGKLIHDFKKL